MLTTHKDDPLRRKRFRISSRRRAVSKPLEAHMTQQTDRSNRFVLALVAILGAFLAIVGWYRLLA
jgi:hypothetical protein